MVPTDTTSGNQAVDNGGDNGDIWATIFGNAGSILTGGASLVNSFKGNTPTTNVYQAPATPAAQVNPLNNIWVYVIGLIVLALILFVIFKK